jgi:hypothetical protein
MTLEGIFQAKQRRVVMGIPIPTGFDDGAGPNRTSNWHFYNLRHENWLNPKQFATFYLLPILKIFGRWI